MPYLLRIDASSRSDGSHSRRLADAVEARWRVDHPGFDVRRRDLASERMPHISVKTIAGFWTPPAQMTPEIEAATAVSDALIAELKGADALLISAPMYNFGVPSALKAWIDQVVRVNRTFAYDGAAFTGLVAIRKAYLALSYGAAGYAPGASLEAMNFLEPYLLAVVRFLGLSDIDVFRIEGATGSDESLARAHGEAIRAIERAFARSAALA